jgi:NADPH:quinone reductase-like Zn-dependent oxidoreductase
MKAMMYTQYGSPDVIQFREIDKPVPKPDEVLVRTHAASINAGDWYMLSGTPYVVRLFEGGLRRPKNQVLGMDIAGKVEAVGNAVTGFKPGDDVYGDVSASKTRAFSEYVAVPEKYLALKPPALSYEEAAAVPVAAVTALQALRDKGEVKAGQQVLINGASGGVGTFAVQIAKSFGAEVTAVCSTRHIDTIRSLGADHVIDYTKENFTRNGKRYDVIIGANGYHSLRDYKRSLAAGGQYVMTGGTMKQIFSALLLGSIVFMGSGKKAGTVTAKPSQSELNVISDLIVTGKVRPVIDRCYPLNELADAFRYFRDGHPTGKVVISIA